MINLSSVSKTYTSGASHFTALNNINLSLAKGSYTAVVGKSGSGKSTLLNMLTGIDHPDSGTVIINDKPLHNLNEVELAQWRGANVGIVFQFFQLIPTLTIKENLLLPMYFVNVIPRSERERRIDQLLQQVGIKAHADKFPAALSGGEQQRAALARALVNNPPILVADEPTGNLDSVNASEIQNLFKQLVKSGKTVIVVTHEEVSHTGYDRIIRLHDGQLIQVESNVA